MDKKKKRDSCSKLNSKLIIINIHRIKENFTFTPNREQSKRQSDSRNKRNAFNNLS